MAIEYLLLETGDKLLIETGDKLLLEELPVTPPGGSGSTFLSGPGTARYQYQGLAAPVTFTADAVAGVAWAPVTVTLKGRRWRTTPSGTTPNR